jgi:DNA processing protein
MNISDQNIFEISLADIPVLLKEIPNPPKKLYARGKISALSDEKKFLCIVGSRRNSQYGKDITEKIISGLQGLPVVIVSGLALGIDSIAHEAALAAGLATIAVPGSGLADETLHPRSNYDLSQKILDAGGLLISEWSADVKARPQLFPQRNRIMAGMSHAVLVVEAGDKSGTLITSRLALDYNRDVFAVPGEVFNPNSFGPNNLIKEGALLVRDGYDVASGLGLEKYLQSDLEANTQMNLPILSEEERVVVDYLYAPLSQGALIRALPFTIEKSNSLIMMLILKGLIKENAGILRINKK